MQIFRYSSLHSSINVHLCLGLSRNSDSKFVGFERALEELSSGYPDKFKCACIYDIPKVNGTVQVIPYSFKPRIDSVVFNYETGCIKGTGANEQYDCYILKSCGAVSTRKPTMAPVKATKAPVPSLPPGVVSKQTTSYNTRNHEKLYCTNF
jgi:hypothetical protein